MTYVPDVNDYVVWTDTLGKVIEGWIYFVDSTYITIEIGVRDKPECPYESTVLHKKTHCCVLCFPENYHQLEYICSRPSKHHNINPWGGQLGEVSTKPAEVAVLCNT